MRQRAAEFQEVDVRIKVITFDADPLARAYVKQTKLTWPLLLDRDRQLYHAYHMLRGNWWDIYGLPSVLKYIQLMLGGQMPGKPGEDWRQLGGDVLIDPAGIVRVHYVSSNPHDRPSVESILAVVRSQPS